MTLDLDIRLVILLPTTLFVVGFILKCVIEKKCLEKIIAQKSENFDKLYEKLFHHHKFDFFFIFSIESVFLFLANGLIVIFELKEIRIGIILLVTGVVLSMFSNVGAYTRNAYAGIVGFLGVFGLSIGEFAYFFSYDIEIIVGGFPLQNILFSVGFLGGIIIGIMISGILKIYNWQEF